MKFLTLNSMRVILKSIALVFYINVKKYIKKNCSIVYIMIEAYKKYFMNYANFKGRSTQGDY